MPATPGLAPSRTMPIPDPIPGSRRSMRILRNMPGPLFLLMFLGVVLLVVGYALDDTTPREDAFAVVGGKKSLTVVRFDLPPGWSVKYRSMKNGSNAVALFAPNGAFAFEVDRVAAPDTAEAFAERNHTAGAIVEQRPTAGGETVVAARESAADRWTEKWRVSSDGRVERVTYFAGPDQPCLRFTLRSTDAAAFEPVAFSLFLWAAIVPADDPRAHNSIPDAQMVAVKWWLTRGGGWLLGVALAVTLLSPLVALYFVVTEAAAGSPHLREIERPTLPEKAEAQLERLERGCDGLEALGFVHAGWFRTDDYDETHVSAWRHPEWNEYAFVQYLPITAACKLRLVRLFPDGWVLVSSTRLTDLSYPPRSPAYLQVKPGATAAELWEWHRNAESLFPPRSTRGAESSASPREVYVGLLQRAAGRYMSSFLWFVRYDPFGELWRMWRRSGVSVREQIDRGWALDPATTFPDPHS